MATYLTRSDYKEECLKGTLWEGMVEGLVSACGGKSMGFLRLHGDNWKQKKVQLDIRLGYSSWCLPQQLPPMRNLLRLPQPLSTIQLSTKCSKTGGCEECFTSESHHCSNAHGKWNAVIGLLPRSFLTKSWASLCIYSVLGPSYFLSWTVCWLSHFNIFLVKM